MPPACAEIRASFDTRIAAGEQSRVSDTAERLPGRSARSFAAFVEDVRRR